MMKNHDATDRLRRVELSITLFKEGFGAMAAKNEHLTLQDYALMGEMAQDLEKRLTKARTAVLFERRKNDD
ncbi:MAG: hypothetical protein KIG36_01210 [Eubacteriales bacterium]|nr:hypothetical protein [Eubacteriales bacterium]